MKKTYVSPHVELVCFMPAESLASWNLDGNKSWKFFNHWGSLGKKENNTTGTVSGIMNWYDQIGDNPNGNLDLD